MDNWVARKLFLPGIIIAIMSTVFIYELKNVTDLLFIKRRNVLVVGILSAPENYDKRLSIRKTWLQLMPEISSSYYFIIGNDCPVPPTDRANLYSCTDLPYVLPQNLMQDTEFTTMKIHSIQSKSHVLDYVGFGFFVRSSIAVKKIGILRQFVEAINTEIQVQLISAADNSILALVSFSLDMLSDSDSVFITKNIKTVNLKNNDEVFVKIETAKVNKKFYPNCSFTKWHFEPNVLHFTYLWEEDRVMPQPFTDKSCSFVFLTYNILDIKNIREHIKNKTTRQMEWKKYNKKLIVNLKNESQTYQDILFVDVIDVYRNLSKKMIQFYKKVVETEYFHYILKADDDSFIDLLRVYNQLQLVSKKNDNDKLTETECLTKPNVPKFWVWSYIKEYWKVQRAGKWREDYYLSALYPSFPCGGGYVINKQIADYIVANEQNLHNFQGEDVSLGIWLSSLSVVQHKTSKKIPDDSYSIQKFLTSKFGKKNSWNDAKSKVNNLNPDLCEWTCNNKRKHNLPLCNKVQLSVQDMYKTWIEYINSGFL